MMRKTLKLSTILDIPAGVVPQVVNDNDNNNIEVYPQTVVNHNYIGSSVGVVPQTLNEVCTSLS